MNNSGQVSVELKLLMDSLRKQAKEAAAILQSALKGSADGQGTGAAVAKKKQDEVTEAVKKTTKALKDQKQAAYEAWKASLPAPQVYGVPGSAKAPPSNWAGYGPTMNPTQGPMPAGGGGGLATSPGYTGPVPPVIPPPVAQPSMMQRLAPIVTAVSTAFMAARQAVNMVVSAFKNLIGVIMNAAEAAKRLYAKSLVSGMTIGFSSKRSLLADAIGVSEESVYKYADAVKYLNGRMNTASIIMAQTTPKLTALSYEWSILKADTSALVAQISTLLQPAMVGMIKLFDLLAKAMSGFAEMIKDKFKFLLMASSPVLGIAAKLGGSPSVPNPASSANRMQGSAWERMGLVLGSGGKNHAEQTARNTSRIAMLTEKMVGRFANPPNAGQIPMPSYP